MMYTAQEVHVMLSTSVQQRDIQSATCNYKKFCISSRLDPYEQDMVLHSEMRWRPGSSALWYQMSTINMGGMVLCQLRIPTKMKVSFPKIRKC